MITRRVLIVLATSAVLVVAGSGVATAASAPTGTPTAKSFKGVPSVGAIFARGLNKPHGCSASVVRSPLKNLVLTAAHCVAGTGAGLLFAPGYVSGRTPYGVWRVQRAYVSWRWVKTRNRHDDYAFLTVAPASNGAKLQNVTGGSVLGVAVHTGVTVTDIAYPHGIKDKPITCSNKIVYTKGYPTFNCHGYPGGTSGSPFLVIPKSGPNTVVGLIGGLYEGGCYEWNSFSAPFGRLVHLTYLRAAYGRRANVVPSPGASGC